MCLYLNKCWCLCLSVCIFVSLDVCEGVRAHTRLYLCVDVKNVEVDVQVGVFVETLLD